MKPDRTSLTRLVAGNNGFAVDLYRQLSKAQGNLFCSPFSLSSALAMTFAGARGNTAGQMAQTLHFDLDDGDETPYQAAFDVEEWYARGHRDDKPTCGTIGCGGRTPGTWHPPHIRTRQRCAHDSTN